jgi:hypothetical protein
MAIGDSFAGATQVDFNFCFIVQKNAITLAPELAKIQIALRPACGKRPTVYQNARA